MQYNSIEGTVQYQSGFRKNVFTKLKMAAIIIVLGLGLAAGTACTYSEPPEGESFVEDEAIRPARCEEIVNFGRYAYDQIENDLVVMDYFSCITPEGTPSIFERAMGTKGQWSETPYGDAP